MNKVLFGILFLFLSGVANGQNENEPYWVFNEGNRFSYTPEEVVSNLVAAINERCLALYQGYTFVTNCGKVVKSHNLYVSPINTQSAIVAWGDGLVSKTVTNAGIVSTNYFVKYEFDGDQLPEGYVWVPQNRLQVSSGPFAGQASSLSFFKTLGYVDIAFDESKFIESRVLFKVLNNNYTDIDGLRVNLIPPYNPCESNVVYTASLNSQTLSYQIATKTRELTQYYLDEGVSSIFNTNAPWFDFRFDGRFRVPTEEECQEDRECSIDWLQSWQRRVGFSALGANRIGYPDNQRFKIPQAEYWLNDKDGPIANKTRINNQISFSAFSIPVDVDGYLLNNFTSGFVTANFSTDPSTNFASFGYYEDYYYLKAKEYGPSIFLDSQTNYVEEYEKVICAEVYWSSVEYIDNTGGVYRVLTPTIVNQYGNQEWASQGSAVFAHGINSLINNKYYIYNTVKDDEEYLPMPNIDILAILNGVTQRSPGNVSLGYYFGDPDGNYAFIRTDGFRSSQLNYFVVASNFPYTVKSNIKEKEQIAAWTNFYKSRFILQNPPVITNYFDPVRDDWFPRYDINSKWVIVREKKLLDNLFYWNGGDNFPKTPFYFDYDISLSMWRILKRMKKTRAPAYAYNVAMIDTNRTPALAYSARYFSEYPTYPIRSGPPVYLTTTNNASFSRNINNLDDWKTNSVARIINASYSATAYIKFNLEREVFNGVRNTDYGAFFSLDFLKHPSVSGSLVCYGAEENNTYQLQDPYTIEVSGQAKWTIRGCVLEIEYEPRPAIFRRPKPEITDLGRVIDIEAGFGSETVNARHVIPNIDYSFPDIDTTFSYSYPGDFTNPGNTCNGGERSGGSVFNEEERVYHFDFIWEWNFKYK
jgi:hypothetical protein